jgi:endonuclease-3
LGLHAARFVKGREEPQTSLQASGVKKIEAIFLSAIMALDRVRLCACQSIAPLTGRSHWLESGSMKKTDVDEFFRRLKAEAPAPESDLAYRNSYTLVVAVVLSAQATDAGVNKATRALFAKVRSPKAMVALGLDALKTYIKSIGLYNTKARNIIGLSKQLIRDHGGKVPWDRAALEALPGVGRKTANVVLNVAFGEPTMAVDTHVFRVSNRTGMAPGKTPLAVEQKLLAVIADKWMDHAHHWLILHGRYTCMARKPKCTECMVNDLCAFKGKTTV